MFDFLPPSSPPPVGLEEIEAEQAVRSERRNSVRAEDLLEKAIEGKKEEQRETKAGTVGRREGNKLKKKASVMSLRFGKKDGKRERVDQRASNESQTNGNPSKATNGETRPKDSTEQASDQRRSTTSTQSPKKPQTPIPAFNEWSAIKLLEQYDPDDLTTSSQPWAYIGDYMVEVKLGTSITDEISKYDAKLRREEGSLSTPSTPLTPGTPGLGISGAGSGAGTAENSPVISQRELRRKSRRAGWFEKLRDALQKEEEVGWHVVVCGDEERAFEIPEEEMDGMDLASPVKSPRSGTMSRMFWRKKGQGVE